MARQSFLLAAAVFLLPGLLQAATLDPGYRFSTLETEHFHVHYHKELASLAPRASALAEEAHCLLVRAFQWSPAQKTHMVLVDSSDLANGFATVLPYNLIYVYTVPPLPDMTVGQYEDWLRTVILHEYAHVATMDAARGYARVMRGIFGKPLPGTDPLSALLFFAAVPPNVLMPDWWLEGAATWAESEFTGLGRGKGTWFEMIYRTAVHEDALPRIDEITGDMPDWPGGSSPYIWGLALMRHIVRHDGGESLGFLNRQHAGRAPYFISAPPKRLTGKHYVALYEDMIEEMRSEQEEKIAHLSTEPLTDAEGLPIRGERLTNPRISPDGTLLALNRQDPHGHEAIIVLDADGHEVHSVVRRLPSDHSITWHPDGTRLYYTQADLERGYNLFQDLYVHDLARNVSRRLTRRVRVKDPDLSPDGSRFALVRVDGKRQSLALLPADGDEDGLSVIKAYEGMRVSGPRWSPEGRRVVFSLRNSAGISHLMLWDETADSVRLLLTDAHDNFFPTWSPSGDFVLFTSDRTGVFNLFAYRLSDGSVLQVTHLVGGALQPEVARGGDRIVFSNYHATGFSIASIPYDPATWRERTGPSVEVSWPTATPEGRAVRGLCAPEPVGPIPGPEGNAFSEAAPYSALGSLAPGFWLPTLWADHDGLVGGALTAGQDALGYHAYIVHAGQGVSGHAYYDAVYYYDRFYPTIELAAFKRHALYNRFRDDEDLHEKSTGARIGITLPLRRLERRLEMTIGYQHQRQERLEGPEDVFEGRRDFMYAGLSWDSALGYPYSVSREEGRRLAFTYRDYARERGSEVTAQEYLWDYEEFLGLGRHHVLYLNLAGASSEGERIPQQAFQVGGIPGGNPDFPLRGYEQGFRTGRYVLTGTLEYRAPVVYVLRGIGSKPFFLDRVHLAVFTDAGIAWSNGSDFTGREIQVGIGTEGRVDLTLGYRFRLTPALGVAYGISGDGELQVYLTVYVDL